MVTEILGVLRKAGRTGGRAVLLVPEAIYGDALKALTCAYENPQGRSAKQPDGTWMTILTPRASPEEVTGPYNLYLAGWGKATPQDEKGAVVWMNKATQTFTEGSLS
jgi:hypothetical protein